MAPMLIGRRDLCKHSMVCNRGHQTSTHMSYLIDKDFCCYSPGHTSPILDILLDPSVIEDLSTIILLAPSVVEGSSTIILLAPSVIEGSSTIIHLATSVFEALSIAILLAHQLLSVIMYGSIVDNHFWQHHCLLTIIFLATLVL